MFGYQQTPFNYGTYASANGQQQNFANYGAQSQNSSTAAASNAYTASQYSLAASAYAQYSHAATQQANAAAAAAGYMQPPPPPDYQATSGAYGAIGGGKSSGVGKTPATGSNATHYAGYEAAVYAAASSYMQAKNPNVGGPRNWMAKPGGGGYGAGGGAGGKYPKKRYGLGHQNRDMQQFFCETCKISCAGQAAYKDHLEGKPHKKKEQSAKNEANTQNRGIGFRCEVCDLTCSSKDTYDAHIKGQKHQRTVALLRRMGKPVPAVLDTLVSANQEPLGQPIPTVGASGGPLKKVVGVTGTKFVGGTTLTTTGEELKTDNSAINAITGAVKPQDLERALLHDAEVKPVGHEFVEEEKDATGKFLTFVCKLCDCKFSDKNAKDIHMKGKKHRMQYKQKVDPSLRVEMKTWGKGRQAQSANHYFSGPIYQPPPQQPRSMMPMQRVQEMMDDKHVLAKLQLIQLSLDEVKAVERLAAFVEKTLKAVSDALIGDEAAAGAAVEGEPKKDEERQLKGVMRVGLLAKQLLLKQDKQFDMVVLCSKIPTLTLLKQVAEQFKKLAEISDGENLTISEVFEDSALDIAINSAPLKCRVTFTCVLLREGNDPAKDDANVQMQPEDPLPKGPCLNALAELRHTKFYQVKCAPLHSVNSTVKIVRDIGNRVRTWASLDCWTIELLVEKTLSSLAMALSPGDAVRRLFEAISSGQYLSKRSKLVDPCEKEPVDVLASISDQEREDITSSAQHALRLIAYNQLYKILGIERLPDGPRPAPADSKNGARGVKRPLQPQHGGESPADGGGTQGHCAAAADSSANGAEEEGNVEEKKPRMEELQAPVEPKQENKEE